jgi:hypothetical protein
MPLVKSVTRTLALFFSCFFFFFRHERGRREGSASSRETRNSVGSLFGGQIVDVVSFHFFGARREIPYRGELEFLSYFDLDVASWARGPWLIEFPVDSPRPRPRPRPRGPPPRVTCRRFFLTDPHLHSFHCPGARAALPHQGDVLPFPSWPTPSLIRSPIGDFPLDFAHCVCLVGGSQSPPPRHEQRLLPVFPRRFCELGK